MKRKNSTLSWKSESRKENSVSSQFCVQSTQVQFTAQQAVWPLREALARMEMPPTHAVVRSLPPLWGVAIWGRESEPPVTSRHHSGHPYLMPHPEPARLTWGACALLRPPSLTTTAILTAPPQGLLALGHLPARFLPPLPLSAMESLQRGVFLSQSLPEHSLTSPFSSTLRRSPSRLHLWNPRGSTS